MTWFNENDPIACAVLRHCYDGVVCERSIKDVRPGDLDDYHSRRHWFAGAGLWEVACCLAGWPAERELWTASCPCQGESVAGKRLGALDPRDLWPDFFARVRARRPACVVGEQVDAAISSHWLDRAAADMENAGYAFRAVDIPACAVDAPHRRNRIYWVALDDAARRRNNRQNQQNGIFRLPIESNSTFAMADTDGSGRRGRPEDPLRREKRRDVAERADGGVAHPNGRGGNGLHERIEPGHLASDAIGSFEWEDSCSSSGASFWSDAEWLRCADGKARRRAKSGVRLLVDGLAGRIDLWRLAGNSIVPQVAAQVLAALMDVT